jgi:hypothetical protein
MRLSNLSIIQVFNHLNYILEFKPHDIYVSHYFVIRPNPPAGILNNPYDSHDGTTVQWERGGTYFRYSMRYGDCEVYENNSVGRWDYKFDQILSGLFENFNCAPVMLGRPFGESCQFHSPSRGQTVHIWSSEDGLSWTDHGDAFGGEYSDKLKYDSILFRPAVIYNAQSGTYVMWVNRIPRGRTIEEGYHDAGFVVRTKTFTTLITWLTVDVKMPMENSIPSTGIVSQRH